MDKGLAPGPRSSLRQAKSLLHEIIPRLGLPLPLQSDSGPAFMAPTVQNVFKALGIKKHIASGDPNPLGRWNGPTNSSSHPGDCP